MPRPFPIVGLFTSVVVAATARTSLAEPIAGSNPTPPSSASIAAAHSSAAAETLANAKAAFDSKDYATALALYRQAASQGNAEAQTQMGGMSYLGLAQPVDYQQAMSWYRQAAEQHYPLAQYNLGAMYSAGKGAPQDYAQAMRWWRLAADQGLPVALYSIGTLYAGGLGVNQDDVQARAWIVKAAALGSAPAKTWLARNPGSSSSAATAEPPASLETVIDRYFDWRGGKAYEQLRSIHQSGELDIGGVHETGGFWLDRTGRRRDERDIGGVKGVSAASATDAWDTNPNGQVQSDPSAVRADRRYASIEFGDALKGRDGATVALAGTIQGRGKVWSIVKVGFGDADVYNLVIDPQTGELAQYHFVEDGQVRQVDFGDWRMVDGVRIPFLQATTAPSGQFVVKTTTAELNRPFDAALFERPTVAHKAIFNGDARSTGWIDFEFYAGRMIFIPVKVNGHDAVALLDNGVTTTALDGAFAASLGLKPEGAGVTMNGVNGSATGAFIPGVSIQVGNLTLKDLTALTIETGPLAKMAGRPLPIFLGDEVFNELVVDIDFANHRIQFRDPRSVAKPAAAVELPLVRNGTNRLATVSLEQGPAAQVAVDLGNSGTLDIFPDYALRGALLDGRLSSQSLLGGAGGTITTETEETLRSVDFAGARLTAVPADFPTPNGATYSSRVQGALGIGVLSRYRLMFDYSHDRLYAIANLDAATKPFAKDRLGLSMLEDGADLSVVAAAPGSPAAAAGFKAGDRVALIDGKPIAAWPADKRHQLAESQPGTKIEITLANGAAKSVTLEDYF